MADCIGTDCKREGLQAEVERLRGIVQADLEEKAEAWGEVERLRADAERYQFISHHASRLDIGGLSMTCRTPNFDYRIDSMRASGQQEKKP